MDILERQPQPAPAGAEGAIINDFSLAVATANGTGSQTANLTLLRALFKMGVPVHGKNIFPSNIQGLPTWYHIRVSAAGYIARREPELLVAFNPATLHEDIRSLPPGGVCIYNTDLPSLAERGDVTYYGLPVKALLENSDLKGKLKDYVANMVYVGGVAHLLGIPPEAVEEALSFHFGGRKKLIDSNMAVVRDAYAWAQEHLEKRDPYRVEKMNKTDGLIMMTGNEAGALGAVFGGASVAAWYPITPSTSFIDAFKEFLPKLRQTPDGRASYAVLQAEDELAAIGMVLGAGWAGARSLTATSGPGISLMSEFAGLGYFAEVPAVIWDIQRVGPSTGLPTRTSQGDVTAVYYLGHGDTKNVILFPSSTEECFEFGHLAHDLADRLQTPIFVLSDLDLGMNNWMGRPFPYPEQPLDRGKLLTAEEVTDTFARYLDLDGDGVTYRTIPGNEALASAWFGRGTGHNEHAVYSERPEDWENNMTRLARKFDTARTLVPPPVVEEVPGASFGVIAFGTTRYALEEARDQLREAGTEFSFLRLRALPFGPEVRAFTERLERVYVLELNRDGQLCGILRSELPDLAAKLIPVAHLDGMPLTASWVRERLNQEERNRA